MKAQIESGTYTIDVRQAFPLRGRSVQLSSDYGLTIRGDSIYSYLPYFGRAYSVPYGGGQGLSFDAPVTDYKVQAGRKGVTIIIFNTRNPEDYYQFRINVSPNGMASVMVTPGQRQSISFSGNLRITADSQRE